MAIPPWAGGPRVPASVASPRIRRALNPQGYEAVILGERVLPMQVHWHAGLERTRPHYLQDCPFCGPKTEPERWAAFIAAAEPDTGALFVCWLTHLMGNAIYYLGEERGTCRGMHVRLYRKGYGKGSRGAVDLLGHRTEAHTPLDFDIFPVLAVLFTVRPDDLRRGLGYAEGEIA